MTQPHEPRTDRWLVSICLAWGALISMPIWWIDPFLNHDVAAIAGVGERMLAGELLYTELPQPNPPLVFYVEAVWVMLGRMAGVDIVRWMLAGVCLLTGLLVALCAWTLKRLQIPESPSERLVLALVVATAAFGFQNQELGQRDPIMLLATLPYLLSVVGVVHKRRLPREWGALVGLLAGLGLCLKPQFVLIPILLEGWALWRTRRVADVLRSEVVLGVTTVVAYYTWVILGTDFFANVSRWAAGYKSYGAYGSEPSAVLMLAVPKSLVVTGFLLMVSKRPSVLRDLSVASVLTMLPVIASVLLQGKAFGYHLWPLRVLEALALVAAVLDSTKVNARLSKALGFGVVLLMATVDNAMLRYWLLSDSGFPTATAAIRCVPVDAEHDTPERVPIRAVSMAYERWTEPGDRTLTLSTAVSPFSVAMLQAGVVDSLTVSTMLVADLYSREAWSQYPMRYHDDEERSDIETAVLDGLANDLARFQPQLVVVDSRADMFPLGKSSFRVLDFYTQHPDTARAFEQDYQEQLDENTGGCFRYFVRKSP